MANKFVSLLESIGKDFEKGFEKVLPYVGLAEGVVGIADPALAPAFDTVVGVVTQTEQKYAAMGQQTGTGTQKLAEAVQIAGPAVSQILSTSGRPSDSQTVTNYVNAVVALLNATPAPGLPAVAPAK